MCLYVYEWCVSSMYTYMCVRHTLVCVRMYACMYITTMCMCMYAYEWCAPLMYTCLLFLNAASKYIQYTCHARIHTYRHWYIQACACICPSLDIHIWYQSYIHVEGKTAHLYTIHTSGHKNAGNCAF